LNKSQKNSEPSEELHPKMLKRWARVYLQKYVEEGKPKAEQWATRTIPKKYYAALSAEVKRHIGRK
jgi:hypothetical protein